MVQPAFWRSLSDIVAFASAASSAPKSSALAKSKAVVGLKGEAPKRERKGDDNAHRVSEASHRSCVTRALTNESALRDCIDTNHQPSLDRRRVHQCLFPLDRYRIDICGSYGARLLFPSNGSKTRGEANVAWIDAACQKYDGPGVWVY